MKIITIHCHSKNEGGHYSESININGLTKEQIEATRNEIWDRAENSLGRFYYEVECFDSLTEEEENILSELDLDIDY